MKKLRSALTFVLLVSTAFGDTLEIESYVNARSAQNGKPRFNPNDHNILYVLKPKTHGTILSKKRFPPHNPAYPGNVAYQIRVEDGPHKGDVVWVLYRPDRKHIQLLSSNGQPANDMSEAARVRTLKRVPAQKAPEDDSQKSAEQESAAEITQQQLSPIIPVAQKPALASTTEIAPAPKASDVPKMADTLAQVLVNGPLTAQQAGCVNDPAGIPIADNSCHDLQIGQSRKIGTLYLNSPTGLSAFYKLTRTGASSYDVGVNIDFVDETGDPQNAMRLRDRTQACLARASLAMIGPGGEKLNLHLTDASDPDAPQKNVIHVRSTLSSSDSQDWSTNANCADITHETLHLFGLVDEYPASLQPARRFQAEDCRSIGPTDSVMYSPTNAYTTVFGTSNPFVISCECTSAKCRNAFANPSANFRECPDGSVASSSSLNYADLNSWKTTGVQKIDATHIRIVRGNTPNPGTSLLEPGHFNAIVHPGCQETQPYYECGINAYSTTSTGGGSGCRREHLPSFCGDTTWVTKNFTR